MKMTVWRTDKCTGGSDFEATKIPYIQGRADLLLCRAQFTVNSLKLLPNCPKFKNLKLLPSRVQSAVSQDAFPVFVSVLGGTDPALTTENLNDLYLLCEEFEFVVLCSKVSAFQDCVSVIDEEESWWN
jgi:hypothetical protein